GQAARLEPGVSRHWGNQGDALEMLGRHPEAREAYLTAARLSGKEVELSPQDAEARSRHALYCARSGAEGCDALDEGERAEHDHPNNAEIVFRNAVILHILGRQDEALDRLEKAVHLGLSRSEIQNTPGMSDLSSSPRYQTILALAS